MLGAAHGLGGGQSLHRNVQGAHHIAGRSQDEGAFCQLHKHAPFWQTVPLDHPVECLERAFCRPEVLGADQSVEPCCAESEVQPHVPVQPLALGGEPGIQAVHAIQSSAPCDAPERRDCVAVPSVSDAAACEYIQWMGCRVRACSSAICSSAWSQPKPLSVLAAASSHSAPSWVSPRATSALPIPACANPTWARLIVRSAEDSASRNV